MQNSQEPVTVMLDPLWDSYARWRDQFAEAMDTRLFGIAHLDGLIWSGRARFWASESAAIVAEIKAYPSGLLAVEGLVAAGELEEIKALIPLAEQWGRERGATLAMIASRPGWARALAADGYETHQVMLAKEL